MMLSVEEVSLDTVDSDVTSSPTGLRDPRHPGKGVPNFEEGLSDCSNYGIQYE